MRRGKSGSAVRETVDKLREAIPDLTLRTSLIVGFPGETDADFKSSWTLSRKLNSNDWACLNIPTKKAPPQRPWQTKFRRRRKSVAGRK